MENLCMPKLENKIEIKKKIKQEVMEDKFNNKEYAAMKQDYLKSK